MKVLKLHVSYDAYYGGSVDEYMLLPLEVNGELFDELEEGVYKQEVYLGEIEGKHSEVYGDLDVEIINLNDYNHQAKTELINGSFDGEFECYLEGKEESYKELLEEEDIDYTDKIKPIVDKYNLELSSWSIVTLKVYEKFIEELKQKYTTQFKTVTILEKDYEAVIRLLSSSNIKIY